jgi:hypothetical protein
MMGWRDVLCVDDFPADKVRLDTVSGEYVYGSGSWEDGMVYGSAVNGQGIWTEKLQIESLQVFHCLRYIWHSSHSIMLSPSLSWRSIATSRSFQLDKSWCLETKAPTTLATYQKLQLYDNDMFPQKPDLGCTSQCWPIPMKSCGTQQLDVPWDDLSHRPGIPHAKTGWRLRAPCCTMRHCCDGCGERMGFSVVRVLG